LHLSAITHLRKVLMTGIAACAMAPLVAAQDAHAGQYVHLHDCGDSAETLHLPSGPNNSNNEGWIARASGAAPSSATFACSGWQGMYADLNSSSAAVADGDWSGFTYNAPAATKISGIDMPFTSFTAPGDGTRRGAIHTVTSRGYDLASRSGQGASSGEVTLATPLLDETLRVGAYCSADPGYSCWNNALTSWVNVVDPAVRLVDETNPVAGTTTGLAVNDATWKGAEDLSYSATDTGGGLAKFRLYIDGQLKDEHSVLPLGYYATLCIVRGTNADGHWIFGYPKPCPDSISRTESIDTTQLPDGQHTITAKVVDASQNATTLYSASKLIANDPPVNSEAPRYETPTSIVNAPTVGTQLTAIRGVWGGASLSFAYGWQRCDSSGANCAQVPGAAALTYTPSGDDAGHRLRVAVTASNAADSVTAYAPTTGVVTAASNGADTTLKPGQDGANAGHAAAVAVPVPTINNNTTTNNTAQHTLVGRVAGEATGVACPADRATLTLQHITGGLLRLRYGKASTAQLELTCTTTGKAITDAKLEIATKTGAHAAVAADVTTDGAGHAILRIAKGASRGITIGYRMYADDPIARATATLKVLVAGKVNLKANKKSLHNGQAVTLRGTLAGGEIPRRGVSLAMQWKDGKRWRPFAQIKTTSKGGFKYAYKFTRTNKTIRYSLRVQVIRGQVDYPYVASASKPVKVTVAP
jgi:hypothetical protein